MAQSTEGEVKETLKNFKWTLIVTFGGVAVSVLASYIETSTFDTTMVLMGLLVSLMIAIITSRYEEMLITRSTLKDISGLYTRFEKLIYPMKVEQTSRVGVYIEAAETLSKFLSEHKNSSNKDCALLIVQRTPSPIFHSDAQKDKLGHREEKKFSDAILEAAELARQGKINFVYAFPLNDAKTLNSSKEIYKIDKDIIGRINAFSSAFIGDKNAYEYWDNLRLYPLNNRAVQPLMVADKRMEIYIEEAKDEIVFIRTENEEISTSYFEKYWKLSDSVTPVSVQTSLKELVAALAT